MADSCEMSKNDDEESVLAEEIEILESIYISELEVKRTDGGQVECVSLLLHPATGENTEEQYVCLTLELSPSLQYPDELPGIVIRNPRGLAEDHVNSLRQELQRLADERRGGHMLYDLIELAKESLTESNIPHGPCAVCLESFTSSDVFSKTQCYHYFHTQCLLRHVEIAEREIERERQAQSQQRGNKKAVEEQVCCPVCRKAIEYDLSALRSAPTSSSASEDFRYKPDGAMRALQNKMAALFQAQKAKGGIIDPEEEQKKLLLSHAQEIVQASEEAAAAAKEPAAEVKEPPAASQDMANSRPESGKGRGRGKPKRDHDNRRDRRKVREDSGDIRYERKARDPDDGASQDARRKDNRFQDSRRENYDGKYDRKPRHENTDGINQDVRKKDNRYQDARRDSNRKVRNEDSDVRKEERFQDARRENYAGDRKPRNEDQRRENSDMVYERKQRSEDPDVPSQNAQRKDQFKEPSNVDNQFKDGVSREAREQRDTGRGGGEKGRGRYNDRYNDRYKGQNRDRYKPPKENGYTSKQVEFSQSDSSNSQTNGNAYHDKGGQDSKDSRYFEEKVKDCSYYGPRRGRGRGRGHAGRSSAQVRPPPGFDTKPRPPPGFEAPS